MTCQENISGDVACELEDGKPDLEFSIDGLTGTQAMTEDFMCGEFDESCVFSFAEGQDLEMI